MMPTYRELHRTFLWVRLAIQKRTFWIVLSDFHTWRTESIAIRAFVLLKVKERNCGSIYYLLMIVSNLLSMIEICSPHDLHR